MKDTEKELLIEKEFRKEKIIITKIGTACDFPGCNNVSGYKIKFVKEIICLCDTHKNYFKKKLNVSMIEVDSRTFNKVPPILKYFLENDNQKNYLQSRGIYSPIKSFSRAWRKPNKKEKDGINIGLVMREINKRSKEELTGTKITEINKWEQKTATGLYLENLEKEKKDDKSK